MTRVPYILFHNDPAYSKECNRKTKITSNTFAYIDWHQSPLSLSPPPNFYQLQKAKDFKNREHHIWTWSFWVSKFISLFDGSCPKKAKYIVKEGGVVCFRSTVLTCCISCIPLLAVTLRSSPVFIIRRWHQWHVLLRVQNQNGYSSYLGSSASKMNMEKESPRMVLKRRSSSYIKHYLREHVARCSYDGLVSHFLGWLGRDGMLGRVRSFNFRHEQAHFLIGPPPLWV